MESGTEKTTQLSAHGLDGTLVEPDWPPLALGELRTLLRQFPGCEEPIAIQSVSPRPFSAASVVRTRQGSVFVKRHHQAIRDPEGLGEEHRFLEFLRGRGIGVPRVLPSASGDTAIQISPWTYEVHEKPAGVDLYGDAISWTPFRSGAHALEAGRALAGLHLGAEGFDAPARPPRPLVASFSIYGCDDPISALERYLACRPCLATARMRRAGALALALLEPFYAELRPWLHGLAPLWTHNDFHPSNLFWNDATDAARVTSIIDFGLSDRTNAVYDLAHAIERSMVGWLRLVHDRLHPEEVDVHFDHLEALLCGYEQIRPLSPAESAALAPMTALCHAEFALTEADYFLSVLGSEEKAHVAIEGYLIAHAHWFRSARGGRLLDALRARRGKQNMAKTARP